VGGEDRTVLDFVEDAARDGDGDGVLSAGEARRDGQPRGQTGGFCCAVVFLLLSWPRVAAAAGSRGREGDGGRMRDGGRQGIWRPQRGGGGACLAPTLRRGGHRATARAGRGLGSGRMGAILGSHCSLPIVCVVVVLTKTVDHGSTILHSTMTT